MCVYKNTHFSYYKYSRCNFIRECDIKNLLFYCWWFVVVSCCFDSGDGFRVDTRCAVSTAASRIAARRLVARSFVVIVIIINFDCFFVFLFYKRNKQTYRNNFIDDNKSTRRNSGSTQLSSSVQRRRSSGSLTAVAVGGGSGSGGGGGSVVGSVIGRRDGSVVGSVIGRRDVAPSGARMGGPLFGRSLASGCAWGGVRHATPVLLQRAIHFLNTHDGALATEGLFRQAGNHATLERVRRQFAAGVDVDLAVAANGDAHVVASLIVQYLRDAQPALVPRPMRAHLLRAAALSNELRIEYDAMFCGICFDS